MIGSKPVVIKVGLTVVDGWGARSMMMMQERRGLLSVEYLYSDSTGRITEQESRHPGYDTQAYRAKAPVL